VTVFDPFTALGLQPSPDLTDEQVRAAWRATATATHPDRPDGGDPAAYSAASAGYALLRTPWSRSQSYAGYQAARNLVDFRRRIAAPGPAPPAAPGVSVWRAVAGTPARIRYGRPRRLAVRILAAVVLVLVLHTGAGTPLSPR
jgi:hypothetical protein